jgi:hypothetical protein
MAEPIDDTSSSAPSVARCPWCSAELPDAEAKTCPSCQANLVGDLDKPLPGVTALDLEALAYRRATPPKKSRLMSWISGDMDYDDPTEAVPAPGSVDRPPIEVRREMLRLERAALIADLAAEAGVITADKVLDKNADPTQAAAAIQAHLEDAAAAEAMGAEVPAVTETEPAASDETVADETASAEPEAPGA